MSTSRLIQKIEIGNRLAKIYYNSWLKEYIVKLIVQNQSIPQADYFTGEKEDAIYTALEMVK